MTQQTRFQMVMPGWMKAAVARLAKEKGISQGELVKDVLKSHIEKIEAKENVDKNPALREASMQIELSKKNDELRNKREQEEYERRIMKRAMRAVLVEIEKEKAEK